MANFTVSNKHRKNKDRNLIPGQQFWVLAGEKEMRGNRLLRILIILIAVLPDKQSIEIGWNNLEKSTANANVRAFFSPINNNSNNNFLTRASDEQGGEVTFFHRETNEKRKNILPVQ